MPKKIEPAVRERVMRRWRFLRQVTRRPNRARMRTSRLRQQSHSPAVQALHGLHGWRLYLSWASSWITIRRRCACVRV